MQWGISSYALTWSIGVPGYERPANPLTAERLLRLAADSRVRLVQIADNLPLHEMSAAQLDELRRTAEELGVGIEVGTRGTEPAHMLAYLEIARALGAGLVRTLITTDDIGAAQAALQAVLPEYERAGVTIGVENHGLHTTKQLAALFDAIGHPLVGCCLDTVNSFGALETPDRVVADLVPYIVNLHIKDFDIRRVDHQMGFAVLGAPAGSGRLDIESLLAAIRLAKRNPTCILELWAPYMGTTEETVRLEAEWLRQSLDYLRRLDFRTEGD